MFKFKPTRKTYSDPIAATFRPGIPLGRKYSTGDICLLHEGFQSSKMFLNSRVLRDALLNSKEYIEEVLEIRITDMRDIDSKVTLSPMEVVEADLAKADIPKSGKSLVLDSEDLIVGNADVEIKDITEEVVVDTNSEINNITEEVSEEVVIDTNSEKKTKKTSKK